MSCNTLLLNVNANRWSPRRVLSTKVELDANGCDGSQPITIKCLRTTSTCDSIWSDVNDRKTSQSLVNGCKLDSWNVIRWDFVWCWVTFWIQKLLGCRSYLVPKDYSILMGCLNAVVHMGGNNLLDADNDWWKQTDGGCESWLRAAPYTWTFAWFLKDEDSRLYLIFGNDFMLFYFLFF